MTETETIAEVTEAPVEPVVETPEQKAPPKPKRAKKPKAEKAPEPKPEEAEVQNEGKTEKTLRKALKLGKRERAKADKSKAFYEKIKPEKKAPKAKKPAKPVSKKVKVEKPKSKKAPAKKKANSVERPKLEGMPVYHPKRPKGPAMIALEHKLKKDRGEECSMKGCKTKTGPRRKWCANHKKEIRKLQLAANNVVWRDRVKRGTAGHHTVYDGRPTQWTVKNKPKAERIIKAGHSVVDVETFQKKIAPFIGKMKEAQA